MRKPLTAERWIEYFRKRHEWRCRPGSPIAADLADFAQEHLQSGEPLEELYRIFCLRNGIRPKPDAARDLPA